MAVADVPENADDNQGMSNSKKIALTIILALLLAGFSYGGYSWWSGAPFRNAMAMIEEDVDFSTLSKDDQKARFEKWRTLDKKLTSDQKSQLNDARERQYEKKDLQKLNTFFAMTKAEQKKQLVDEVNREEKRRIEGEAKRIEECPALGIVNSGGHDGDIHATRGIDLVVFNFGEHCLVNKTERVVSTTVP